MEPLRGVAEACQTNVGDEAAPLSVTEPQGSATSRRPRGTRRAPRLTHPEREMKNFADSIVRFLKEEDGPTAVEYAVMLALIVVVCLGAITTIGTNANATFEAVGNEIAGGGT